MQSAQQLYTERFDAMIESITPPHLRAAKLEAQENIDTSELIDILLRDGEIEINGEMIYQADVFDTIQQDSEFNNKHIKLTIDGKPDEACKLVASAFTDEAGKQINAIR